MSLCLSLAEKGRGHVGSGALVGAVLVRDGEVIAEGSHEAFGGAHAERALLKSFAHAVLPTDTLYVNLEPCCHHGKTPPCVDILIERGVKRIVFGCRDPDPRVSGRGIAALRASRADVIGPVLYEECARFNRGFIAVRTKGRPWITLKSAHTKDGRIASTDGSPLKITSAEQDLWSHTYLRARHDAILVGIGTILTDNPALTVRFVERPPRITRIALDADLRMPQDAQVLKVTPLTHTIIVVSPESFMQKEHVVQSLSQRGVRVIAVPLQHGQFDWSALFLRLLTPSGDYCGITSVLVEGGKKTWSAFRAAGMIDEDISLIGASALSPSSVVF